MGLVSDVRLMASGWRWTRRSLTPHSAEPWLPPYEPRPFRTAWARTPPARVARHGIQRYGLRPLVWTETRPRVEGLDRLESLGSPVVFVANHASHLDAPLVLCSLPPTWAARTAVGAAADYFFDAGWRAAATALAFNAFPVERHGGGAQGRTAVELMRDGWSLLLFPEGTRSADGWMSGFRQGTARLCVTLGVPAVPVAIRGSYAAMPRGRGWPRPGRLPVSVRFGSPVRPEPDEDVAAYSERLRHDLTRLWAEDDTTWWDSLRRETTGSQRGPDGPEGPRWRRVWEATRPIEREPGTRAWRSGDRLVR
ncbi:MAG: lysophospholipid acyltransferase family protein [Actinomycetes bacterium]